MPPKAHGASRRPADPLAHQQHHQPSDWTDDDPRLWKSYETKRRRFLDAPFVRKHFAGVLPTDRPA